MRSFVASIQSTLTGRVIPLKRLVDIEREDGTLIRFSELERDVTVDGHVYVPGEGIALASLPTELNGTSSRMDMELIAVDGGTIDFDDLRDGVYDSAAVTVRVFNWQQVSLESSIIFKGNFGSIQMTDQNVATVEIVGILAQAQALVTEQYSPVCRADLGDRRCKVPIVGFDPEPSRYYYHGEFLRRKIGGAGTPLDYEDARLWMCTQQGTSGSTAPTFPGGGLGTVMTWGAAQFTKMDSPWTKPAQVASASGATVVLTNLTESRKSNPNWFKNGMIIFRTGKLKDKGYEIRGSTNNTIKLFIPLEASPSAGDWVEIFPGCDHSMGPEGNGKFDNIENYRAEPWAPGPDLLEANWTPLAVATAHTGVGTAWSTVNKNSLTDLTNANRTATYNMFYSNTADLDDLEGPPENPLQTDTRKWLFSSVVANQQIDENAYWEIEIDMFVPNNSLTQTGVTDKFLGSFFMGLSSAEFVTLTPPAGIASPFYPVEAHTGRGDDASKYAFRISDSSGGDSVPDIGWPTAGKIYMFALNLSEKKVWIGVNGTWFGDPVAKTGPHVDMAGRPGPFFAAVSMFGGNTVVISRFRASQVQYDIPAGYFANEE